MKDRDRETDLHERDTRRGCLYKGTSYHGSQGHADARISGQLKTDKSFKKKTVKTLNHKNEIYFISGFCIIQQTLICSCHSQQLQVANLMQIRSSDMWLSLNSLDLDWISRFHHLETAALNFSMCDIISLITYYSLKMQNLSASYSSYRTLYVKI